MSSLQYCTLQDRVCVEASGTDAVEFLRGQLTNDPPAQSGAWITAAWNDARGRVRALFDVLRTGDNRCVLIAERETLDAVLKALRMYVLRAKVELRVLDDWRVAAVLGEVHGAEVYRLPVAASLTRIVGPDDAVERALAGIEQTSPQRIELEEIRLGLPRIREASMLQYVPQMLNLDRLGAVSFTKGCYPGQEVVARLHHRGAVKRRMQRFGFEYDDARELPAAGDELVAADGQESVGEVIRAAREGARGELLAVVQLDALGNGILLHGREPIPLLHEPLPYDGGG